MFSCPWPECYEEANLFELGDEDDAGDDSPDIEEE